uniref:TRP C-terminal domain-containing protein n=1 Tax=Phytophthora ramorum TaxID=164328 RepID=H3GGG6_PHYRM
MVNVRAVRGLALVALAIALAAETQALKVETRQHRSLQLGLGLNTGLNLGSITNEATVAPSDGSDSSVSSTTTAPATSTTDTPTAPATEAPSTPATDAPSSALSPVTNLLTTAPTTDAPAATEAPSTPTATTAPSTPATDAPSSVLSPVTESAPSTATTTATTAPSTPATDAPSSVLSPVTDLLTTAPAATEAPSTATTTATTAPSTTTTDAPAATPSSILSPVTNLLTTAPTATESPSTATTAPSAPSTPATDAPSSVLSPVTESAPSTATTTATTAPSTPATDAPSSVLSPVTDLLTTAPAATEAPSTATTTATTAPSTTTTDAPAATSSILSPVTNLLTTAPTATESPSTATTAPSAPTTPARPTSALDPVTDLLTTAPTTDATEAPSTTTTPAATSALDPVTDLLTTAPTATESPSTATTAPSATTTPAATSALDPVTDLLTTAPTATTTPSATTSPATIVPDISTLIPSATTSTPTTTDSPITLIPSTETPITLIPGTDSPMTLTPGTDSPMTLTPGTDSPMTLTPGTETPSTETPSTETPSTATPSTDTPSTDTPSTDTPSTDTPSTDTPSTETPSTTEEPSSSSGSSISDNTKSPSPVTATPNSGSGDETTSSPPPVTKTPSATKSPIAIETNSGSEDEQDASEQKDQTQSDVIMFNASATPITARSGSSDPFAIPDDTTKTEKPVVLNIAGDTDEGGSEELVTYVRGKTATSGSAAATNANVIGGRNTYVDTEDSDVLSSSAAAFHEFLRYASVAFAGISVALLLFFHFVSLDGNLMWVNAAWSPNTWEFLFYVGYLQQMQATSELTLLKTPYFLWDYTDSFAWSNFLVQDTTSSDSSSRRLETIVLGGLVSYADRIGVSEESILTHGVTGFAVIMGVLIAVFLVLAVLAKRKAERALDESSDLNSYTSGVHRLRSVSIRSLGLCVLVWYFALYPLSMLASFEISMEVQSSTMADSLVVAIIALVLVCFGVLAVAGRVIMHKTKDELEQFENLATWGSLYCEYTYRSRMFFVIDVVVQITTGVLVGCVSGDPTQLIVVMGIQALYLACVFIMSPFADQMVLRITYVLGLLKILNFGLAFAFLNSNTMSATARTRVAQAYIGINSIVILVWFVRQLIVFSTYIRAWMVRSNDDSRRSDSVIKYDPQTDTESELWASQFTAGGLNDSRLNQSGMHGATLSLPAGSSMQSMQPSFPTSSVQTSYSQASSQQSMQPSFGSDAHFQQQMARKYEIGF